MTNDQKRKPTVKVNKIHADSKMPVYANSSDSGADVCAYAPEGILISPGKRALVKTGLSIELPEGFECQIRARSGLALKKGITVLNGIGTIDEGYRGEIGVVLINTSDQLFQINHGDRIAQMVIAPVHQAEFVIVDRLSDSDRGEHGFGSSGII